MSRFGSDPQSFFDAVYQETAPWDIGGPQPSLSALFSKYPPKSPALDIGCGSGDLAIFLAQRGHDVLGIDFASAAVRLAKEKTAALPPEIASRLEFQVADGLRPSLLGKQFGSITDSGFLHLFDSKQGDLYLDNLAVTLRPGGLFYLLAFAVEFPVPNVPRGISEEELRVRFNPEKGWRIKVVKPGEFQNRVAPPVPAVSACIERM